MSQEPADPTASSAPSDGVPPTLPPDAADVQPEVPEVATVVPGDEPTPVAKVAPAEEADGPAPVEEPAPVAVTAESGPAPAAEPAAARAGDRWRALAGVLLLFLVAIAVGFGAAFLVPSLANVPVPSGAALASTPPPSPVATPGPASPSPTASRPPSPSPSASATPRSSGVIYTVQRGDILSAIAARYGVTVQAIVAANGLADPNHIEPGQKLLIPVP